MVNVILDTGKTHKFYIYKLVMTTEIKRITCLFRPFEEKAKYRDCFVRPSIYPSWKINVGYNIAIS